MKFSKFHLRTEKSSKGIVVMGRNRCLPSGLVSKFEQRYFSSKVLRTTNGVSETLLHDNSNEGPLVSTLPKNRKRQCQIPESKGFNVRNEKVYLFRREV